MSDFFAVRKGYIVFQGNIDVDNLTSEKICKISDVQEIKKIKRSEENKFIMNIKLDKNWLKILERMEKGNIFGLDTTFPWYSVNPPLEINIDIGVKELVLFDFTSNYDNHFIKKITIKSKDMSHLGRIEHSSLNSTTMLKVVFTNTCGKIEYLTDEEYNTELDRYKNECK